jgi:L-lactate dehydrogenase complex protein LldG
MISADLDELAASLGREAAAAGATVHGPMPLADAFVLVKTLATSPRVLAWEPAGLGIPDAWTRLTALGLEPICPRIPSDPALADLDAIDLGLTSTIGALADTGTLVLASGAGRPRLAWLLPNRHVALVDVRGIAPTMAEFFARAAEVSATTLAPSGSDPLDRAHLAFVTGPSRTADIELTMTRGVHGPRELHVVLLS